MATIRTVGIKYCGGCNPQIERGKVAEALQMFLPDGLRFADDTAVSPWDVGILISGCNVACADSPELRALASRWILVRGAMVDDAVVPEAEIARVIAEKLSRLA